jgi:hypothetical protein
LFQVSRKVAHPASAFPVLQNAETALLLGFGCPIQFPL